MQHEQREPKTNRDSKSRRHRARHSPAPEWGAEALPPAAPSTPESRVSPATPSSGLLLRVACTSGWQHRLFALKSTAQKEVRTRWFRFRHHHLLLWREAGSPTVARLVSSRVCWATEGTSTTPASHLFLSPAEEGGFSGDTQEAEEKMVEKMLNKCLWNRHEVPAGPGTAKEMLSDHTHGYWNKINFFLNENLEKTENTRATPP